MSKTAIIIGAGPAGLTAAYELLKRTDIKPIIIEQSNYVGGISKTILYKGNRIDIGGHRFFSKSDKIMNWWQEILPIQGSYYKNDTIKYKKNQKKIYLSSNGPDPEKTDRVMLIRKRLSRIYFLRKFFDYPISINANIIINLGIIRVIKILYTYIWIKIFPIKNEKSLEDFLINRFGKELYKLFFKDYTEKVWGVSCNKIAADWGTQRIKKLSISRTLFHAIKGKSKNEKSIYQKNVDTSLIGKFMYPKYGPGQMWETVANIIVDKGGIIIKNSKVVKINTNKNQITQIIYINLLNQKKYQIKGDYFISTMPVKDLINALDKIPNIIKKIGNGLQYRDFITVGLLLKKLKIKNNTKIKTVNDLIPDTWIYIQEPKVKIGRIQIFNNWSPYMVADLNKVWIGLEYFCNEGDDLWTKEDDEFILFAINELHNIDIINKEDVLDSTIIRTTKAYPAYFGEYSNFHIIRDFMDTYENLFLIGRNGMHKYNNQDHSMLTAMAAVDNIITGEKSKNNIWNINTQEEYHEEK